MDTIKVRHPHQHLPIRQPVSFWTWERVFGFIVLALCVLALLAGLL